jgi:hypothetical protein
MVKIPYVPSLTMAKKIQENSTSLSVAFLKSGQIGIWLFNSQLSGFQLHKLKITDGETICVPGLVQAPIKNSSNQADK